MTLSNWILLAVLVVLIIALLVIVILVKRKANDYEGICSINHGDHDKHRNDHLL